MKSYILILSSVLLLASCTTAYKSGQTPDDVYYSPERPQVEYVQVEERDDRQYRNYDEYEYRDDRYIRMKIRDRRWSTLDDGYYSYRPYYSYSPYFYNSPWNSYTYWNHYYNPYCGNTVIINPKAPVYNTPRKHNMNVFNNPSTVSSGNSKNVRYTSPARTNTRNASSGSNSGGILRDIFRGSGSSSSSSGTGSSGSAKTSRGSSGSSAPAKSSSSGGASKAPVRKF